MGPSTEKEKVIGLNRHIAIEVMGWEPYLSYFAPNYVNNPERIITRLQCDGYSIQATWYSPSEPGVQEAGQWQVRVWKVGTPLTSRWFYNQHYGIAVGQAALDIIEKDKQSC